jgi:hypothetical protein
MLHTWNYLTEVVMGCFENGEYIAHPTNDNWQYN